MAVETPALFRPIRVGRMTLAHRIVHAPCTRSRATQDGVATDLMAEYLAERVTPGAFFIGEATFMAERAGGFPGLNNPGIWNEDQIAGWKKSVNVVHAQRGYIYLQILAVGRVSFPDSIGDNPYIDAGDIPMDDRPHGLRPRALTIEEIKEYISDFSTAARNAVEDAGFDGIELHSAHGFLIEQFLKDSSNNRTDEYGGSVENMARFVLELVDAVSDAIGEDRVSIRFSPWPTNLNENKSDPITVYTYVVRSLAKRHPNLAYVHFTEPRVDKEQTRDLKTGEGNDVFRAAWGARPFITAGGHTRETALEVTAKHSNVLVAFGRHYTSNPDLPERLRLNLPLRHYERPYFYASGEKGYLGYKKWGEE